MDEGSGFRVLFLITARGGSRSVPDKNLRKIEGISLVGFRAISALKSKYCTRLIISTDSSRIQEDARSYGVEVPFTRPSELATSTAGSVGVVAHTMNWIETETDEQYDAIMLLEPSSPFARPFDYDNAVDLMLEQNANVVLGVREMEVNSAFVTSMDERLGIGQLIDQMLDRQDVRRQDFPKEYTINGALYLFKWDHFKQHMTLYHDRDNSYGYYMDRLYSIEIDEMIDLHWAEFLVKNGYIDMSYWQ